MSSATRPDPPFGLPTLTEVVDAVDLEAPPGSSAPGEVAEEARLVARILEAVQQRVDLVLEARLRELLAPTLARAADLVIREAREDLAATLREIVERAVAQELSRRPPG